MSSGGLEKLCYRLSLLDAHTCLGLCPAETWAGPKPQLCIFFLLFALCPQTGCCFLSRSNSGASRAITEVLHSRKWRLNRICKLLVWVLKECSTGNPAAKTGRHIGYRCLRKPVLNHSLTWQAERPLMATRDKKFCRINSQKSMKIQ